MRPCRPLLLPAIALFAATAAAGDIYRWTDGTGKEHFTTDLQAVPPEHRPGARGSATPEREKPVVVIDEEAAPRHPPLPARVQKRLRSKQTHAHEVEFGSAACNRAREGAKKREAEVAEAERDVERLEDRVHDATHAPYWRARYERHLEEAEERLARREETLEDYVQDQRRAGVPFGCLR